VHRTTDRPHTAKLIQHSNRTTTACIKLTLKKTLLFLMDTTKPIAMQSLAYGFLQKLVRAIRVEKG